MVTTIAGRTLEILKGVTQPIDIPTILISMPTQTKYRTVARALRRMRSRGVVSSKRNGGRYVFWSVTSSQPARMQVSKPSSKGSSGRMTMCRPDNMPTLCAAIDGEVDEFVDNKKAFSAHDITKSVRGKVLNGEVVIDTAETGVVHVSGRDVAKVDHELVKEVVHDLFQRGGMDGYDRVHNRTHWTYQEAQDIPKDDDIDAGDNGVSDGNNYDGSSTL
jgi:hypothetical protein